MVKFITKFNSDATKDLNKHAMKKLIWVLILISLLFTGCGVSTILSDDLIGGIVIIAIGVLYIPAVWLITKVIQKSRNKTMYILSEETLETFTFTEDKVFIEEAKGEKYKAHVETTYDYFYRIDETPTHYFLYISKHQSHVVPKCDIKEGTIEELNTLLFNNLGPKFNMQKRK